MLSRRNLLRAGGSITVAAAASAGIGLGISSAARSKDGKWQKLREAIRGDVVLPGEPNYTLAKQLQITQYDSINPQGIAYCQSADDVRACVSFAQHYGLPVRARSGGHNLSGWSTGEGLVVDLSRINQARVGDNTLTIGVGAQSVDALAALKPHNKQLVTGTCPTVCAGGFLSGGGLGHQTRKFGVGSDRVKSATVVLADGRIVRCSKSVEPDLYWAIRGGGGGNFGIVVDFEVRPIGAPTMVNYDAMWSLDHGAEVLTAWQKWCVTGSNNIGSSLVVMPPHDAGGAPTIFVGGGYLGPKAEIDKALNHLIEMAGAQPISKTVGEEEPYADAMHTRYCGEKTLDQCHRVGQNPDAQLPRTPYQRQSYRMIDRALTVAENSQVLKAWDSHQSLAHRYVQIIAVGGVANQVSRTATAYVHRGAQFLMGYQLGLDNANPPADQLAEATAWTDLGAATLRPVASGSYINFPSSGGDDGHWGVANYGENYARLLTVKRRYDPHNFFTHPRSIGS
ncbi:FAD/FMN-containing dehydrogenase [Herbihabitans rhizosphaerae]|uniref:FAD/FMN-containing dehydrogenase n=1 Tax=Herbihabitans rhizosphaerae TaxID=1872711 RepID=A0A4Q7KJH6_9PSEU|nr:FAD-dependent oxidoreductase [Herbihabitans rhizosphaerae]RZS36334.1 FAD/FMN-containing dehydrogenase [Herbihabitans rhizosphaerae]